ncbi:MAG: fibronectin type III domain-containing protein, partial [Spirosomaceae bacterium]|nr:fibronectin type III domain-containing protein [Spirosomataceae bacterium]
MKKIFHISLLSFLLSYTLQAQFNYPVACTPIVQPKYSLKWSELSTNTEIFKVHLLLKDLTKPSVDAYLKIRLSGVGVDIRTVDGFIPSRTIKLLPGQPVLLNASDLTEYFNISNLEVNGIDISALYAGGKLPPGLYTWYVEAYEIDRNRQVSNTGQALMTVFQNYPPIINTPQNGAILPVTSPPNILMSWTSRSTASFNTVIGKVYTLKMYELAQGDDPNIVANSGIAPFREITTTNPFYNYSASDPALKKGVHYAIQVQETDINGSDDYENDGKSQVVTFSFGKPCMAPQDLIINPIGKGRVELTWLQDNEEVATTVWYKSEGSSVWNSLEATKQSTVISNLRDKTKYQFKVSADCGTPTAFSALSVGEDETGVVGIEIDDSEFDEENEELDPEILDPYIIGIEINTDGTARPVQTLNDIFSKIDKPKCVNDKVSTYEVCSPNHPNVATDGVEELSDLSAG